MYLSEKHASNQNTSSGADPGGRTGAPPPPKIGKNMIS